MLSDFLTPILAFLGVELIPFILLLIAFILIFKD